MRPRFAIFSGMSILTGNLLAGFLSLPALRYRSFPAGLEKLPGRLGIMADDWMAGGLPAICLRSRVTTFIGYEPWAMAMKFGFGTTPEKERIPHIERIAPTAAIPGARSQLWQRFTSRHGAARWSALAKLKPRFRCQQQRLIARVPENANGSTIRS